MKIHNTSTLFVVKLLALVLLVTGCAGTDVATSSIAVSSAAGEQSSSISSPATSSSVSSASESSRPVSSSSANSSVFSSRPSSSSSVASSESAGTYIPGELLPLDQCNSTSQCKTLFGSQADDCSDSNANNSVCMCGRDTCSSVFEAHTLVYAVNVGGNAFTNSQGFEYITDFGAQGESLISTKTTRFNNTQDDALYQLQRYAQTLRYELPVTNGNYSVTIQLAESHFTEAGKRVFNLTAENETAANNLDMYATFGANKVGEITVNNVRVADQSLTIIGESTVNNASIAGIIVTSVNGRATCDAQCIAQAQASASSNNNNNNNNSNNDDAPVATTNGIKHPGMLTNMAQLNLLKKRYEQGDAFTQEQVALMKAHVENSPGIRNPGADNPATGGRNLIYCGSFNKGRDGVTKIKACDWPAEDGVTAYTYALLGFITDNNTYANEAIKYVRAWTNENNFAGFDTEGSNAALQHGWVIPWFANAAEILRYTYPQGWSQSLTDQTTAFIKRMMKLVTDDDEGSPNNWIHARIEAHIASAIWLSNSTMLDTALDRWKKLTRSYIYIQADGAKPVIPQTTRLKDIWKRVWDTPKFVGGLTMETCRDINHQGLGINAIVNSLVMANAQGINILTGNDNRERLTKFLEVMPRWMQARRDNPDGVCNNPIILQGNDDTGKRLKDNPRRDAYPMVYALLVKDSRPLRLAKEDIDKSDPIKASRWLRKWDTLLASTLKPLE